VVAFGVCLAAGLLFAAGAAMAAPEEDEFHKALRAHKIVSLQTLLAHVHRHFHARILRVELGRWHHQGRLRWIYEAKIMTPEGNVLEVAYDANSLELLEMEGGQGQDRRESDDG
jgi:uncharacterized membrane protein YkoI